MVAMGAEMAEGISWGWPLNNLIPWDFVAFGAFGGFAVGLLCALPLIWWATRETKAEKAAEKTPAEKIRAPRPIPDPPPPKPRPEEEDDE